MPWSRSELTIQASNEFGLDLKAPSPQLLVRKRFIRVAQNEVTPIGHWTRRARTEDFSSKIILATKQDRAIDLSCRACGAGAWALGLDSRLGTPSFSQPPTLKCLDFFKVTSNWGPKVTLNLQFEVGLADGSVLASRTELLTAS